MRQLSSAGQLALQDIAQRHGFSTEAVAHMLEAVICGNGHMAQFNHIEFSGSGQWMSGGMTMVSDMFNNHLKGRVDSLCGELALLVANQPDLVQTGSFQSQSQGSGWTGDFAAQSQDSGWDARHSDPYQTGSSLFEPPPPDWWGPDLRWPTSTGAQNSSRYAYFAQACRLAIEESGTVTIYDTLDHQIGGFSQQQSGGAGMTFSSQYGQVAVAQLPVVSVNGRAPQAAMPPQPDALAWQAPPSMPVPEVHSGGGQPQRLATGAEADIFSTLERLADLARKGVLTDHEYQTKKAELLARL